MADVTDQLSREPAIPVPRTDGTAASTRTPDRHAWQRAFANGMSIWGAAVFAYALVNMLVWMTRLEAGPPISGALEVWDRWDTGHYVTIALHGYSKTTENPAFFPVYPLLMRYLEPILPGGMLSAGLIISSAACIVALALIFRLTEDLYGYETAQRTIPMLMAFPFAFYLVAAYNQSLFLALAVGSLYCMRRGYWWPAGLLGAVASGTRQAGALLALAFAYEYLRQHEWRLNAVRWNAAAIALVPGGLIGYMLYCWHTFGDPLRFLTVQSAWGRAATLPWNGTARAIEAMTNTASGGAVFQPIVVLDFIDVLVVPVTVALLVLSAVGPWRLGPQGTYLTIFAAASFLAVLVSPIAGVLPLHGVPRYATEALPAFIVLARMLSHRNADRIYLLPAMAVQGALLLAFFYNIWLA